MILILPFPLFEQGLLTNDRKNKFGKVEIKTKIPTNFKVIKFNCFKILIFLIAFAKCPKFSRGHILLNSKFLMNSKLISANLSKTNKQKKSKLKKYLFV
jgi:hypothetical protein